MVGPQILKMVRRGDASVWNSTSKIALVSSWLATMFCLDGEIKGVDEVRTLGRLLHAPPLPRLLDMIGNIFCERMIKRM